MELTQDNKILASFIFALFVIGSGIFFSQNNSSLENNMPSAAIAPAAAPRNGCVSIEDAGNYVGRETCISGKILKVYTSKSGTTFLDFCENYQTCPFTAVIFKSDYEKFSNLQELEGETVVIKGLVKTYKGKPEIIINGSSQIEIAQ
ncbi:MAG TPA: hypothetical protein PKM84_02635 [Candidatus Pacearchaeota archaeon]|nr:hypothetical protein [Candidatus Pacearchaeota archaeon]